MAETRITDIIEPTTFAGYVSQVSAELSAVLNSGIAVADPRLTSIAASGGRTHSMPFFFDLPSGESNVGSDNPATIATAQKITAGSDVCAVHMRNEAWSVMNLAVDVAGADPLAAPARAIGRFWARDHQNHLINSLIGVYNDNVAANSGDMVHNIYSDIATPLAANLISFAAVTNAVATAGDAGGVFTTIAMHSTIYYELVQQQQITFIQPSETGLRIPMYNGLRVVVDDAMPIVSGTNSDAYISALFQGGAFGYGEAPPSGGSIETQREALAGNGQGEDTIVSRVKYVMHPYGIKWVGASQAGASPTFAELQSAANWQRVYDRKLIRIAFLVTNAAA